MKTPATPGARGPLARQVLSVLRTLKQSPVVDVDASRVVKSDAESVATRFVTPPELADLDPVHGVYVFAHNQLTTIVEELIDLPPLAKLADTYAQAQDEYQPSGPPMSPLTVSYFSSWALFDLVAGAKRESLASVAIDVCRHLGLEPGLIELFEILSRSRLGLYRHEGTQGTHVCLTELLTERRIEAISASGYLGHAGQLWLVRMLPPPPGALGLGDYWVVFNTPYILGELRTDGTFAETTETSWSAYLERTLPKVKMANRTAAYERLMKYGLTRHYWNEYVFLAYVNYRADCIYLAGWPDIPETLPHSKAGQARWGD